MAYVNLWIALSQQAIDEYIDRKQLGDEYVGPMDDTTYKILDRMADMNNVQALFKKVTIATNVYTIFSLYIQGTAKAQEAIDYMESTWPAHFILVGAWEMDGTLLKPVHNRAWEFMPDEVGAIDNSGLMDVVVMQGQNDRSWS